MAILAVHLQLACVQCVTEGDRLQGAVTRIQSFGARDPEEQDARIGASREDQNPQKGQEFVGPAGKDESLGHRSFGDEGIGYENPPFSQQKFTDNRKNAKDGHGKHCWHNPS